MIRNPRVGQRVQIWYAAARRHVAPHHGRTGTVVVTPGGHPRNVLVDLGGGLKVVVPVGNIRSAGRP